MIIQAVKLTTGGYNVTTEEGRYFIPSADTESSYYQDIMSWIAAGNTPEPEFSEAELLTKAISTEKVKLKGSLEFYNQQPVAISVAGHDFSIQKVDLSTIDWRIAGLELFDTSPNEWSDTSGNRCTLTLDEFKELRSGAIQHFNSRDAEAFTSYYKVKSAIEGALTAADVPTLTVDSYADIIIFADTL